jgi:predicted alpha/beta superfamily hydrolase
MIRKKIFFLLLLYASFIFAQNQIPPVTLNRTAVHKLTSSYNNAAYPIFVSLPSSYNSTDKNYPVVYMLDAYSSFGIVTQTAKLLAFNNELPELIIVGISSEGGSKEFIYNRARDYTPTYMPVGNLPENSRLMMPASGGAAKFLEFIEKELIPFVESRYRCGKKDRALIGHSLGGLFAAFALFEKPNLFRRYVMISPALFWDNNYILKQEVNFYEREKSLNAIIYASVGSLESNLFVETWKNFTGALTRRNYTGLKLIAEVADNETHYTIIPHLVTRGLISVFKH